MSKERVQIIIRVMPEEKEHIQQLAKDEDKSMNQFIVDCVLNQHQVHEDDSNDEEMVENSVEEENDSPEDEQSVKMTTTGSVFTLLKEQLNIKDRQINKLQILLDQQQQLSLSDKKENERLRLNIEELEMDSEEGMATATSDRENQGREEDKQERDSEDGHSIKNQSSQEEVSSSSQSWWKFWKN